MRASGVNATIMRVIGKLEQNKMRAVRIVRIGEARITGFLVLAKSNQIWIVITYFRLILIKIWFD